MAGEDDTFAGSMVPVSELASRIQQRDDKQARRKARTEDAGDEEPASKMKSKDDKEEDAKPGDPRYTEDGLPRQVVVSAPDAMGRMIPYVEFKERFADVYKQVDDGRLIVPGYVTSEIRLLKTAWRTRTLRRREQDLLQALAAKAQVDPELATRLDAIRLAIQVTLFKGMEMPPLPEFTAQQVDEWLKLPEVKARVAHFRDMAQEIVDRLLIHAIEVHQAVKFAVHESSLNP